MSYKIDDISQITKKEEKLLEFHDSHETETDVSDPE